MKTAVSKVEASLASEDVNPPAARPAVRGTPVIQRAFPVLLACLAILYVVRLGPVPLYPLSEDDTPTYVVGAVSLAQGQGYRLVSNVDAPPARKYPMGYPLFLSMFIKPLGITRLSVTAMRLSSVVLIVGWIAFLPRLLRYYLPVGISYGAPILIGLTPYAFQLSGQIMSDPLFCCLLLASLTFGEHVLRYPHDAVATRIWPLTAAAVLAGAATAVRTIGAPLLVAMPLCLVWRRRWAEAAVSLVVAIIVVGPLVGWALFHAGGTFTTYFAESARSGIHPISQLITLATRSVAEALTPPLAGATAIRRIPKPTLFAVQLAIGAPAIGIMVGGLIRLLWERSLVGVMGILYLAIVLCWWWDPGRFLLPIYPVLLIGACAGIWGIYGSTRVDALPLWTLAKAALITVVAGTCLYADLRRLEGVWRDHHWGGQLGARQWAQLSSARDEVERLTPPDAVLMTSWPDLMYLLTRRSTIDQPMQSDAVPEALKTAPAGRPLFLLATERGNWISPTHEEYGLSGVADVLALHPGLLRALWRADDGRVAVYSVERGASPSGKLPTGRLSTTQP